MDHGLAPRHVPQQARQGFERRQLFIRVEDVEFRLIGREGSGDVPGNDGLAVGVRRAGFAFRARLGERRRFANCDGLQSLVQRVPVIGETLQHAQGAAVDRHRHQICGCQLLVHEIRGGFRGPYQVIHRHGSEIEEQHEQAPILNQLRRRNIGRELPKVDGGRRAVLSSRRRQSLDVLKAE